VNWVIGESNMTKNVKRGHGFKGSLKGVTGSVAPSPLLRKHGDHSSNRAGV